MTTRRDLLKVGLLPFIAPDIKPTTPNELEVPERLTGPLEMLWRVALQQYKINCDVVPEFVAVARSKRGTAPETATRAASTAVKLEKVLTGKEPRTIDGLALSIEDQIRIRYHAVLTLHDIAKEVSSQLDAIPDMKDRELSLLSSVPKASLVIRGNEVGFSMAVDIWNSVISKRAIA